MMFLARVIGHTQPQQNTQELFVSDRQMQPKNTHDSCLIFQGVYPCEDVRRRVFTRPSASEDDGRRVHALLDLLVGQDDGAIEVQLVLWVAQKTGCKYKLYAL